MWIFTILVRVLWSRTAQNEQGLLLKYSECHLHMSSDSQKLFESYSRSFAVSRTHLMLILWLRIGISKPSGLITNFRCIFAFNADFQQKSLCFMVDIGVK